MNRRQEICRDFQRGNCRFGARCKYLHQLPQQQPRPQQQQRPQQQPRQQHQRNDFGGGGNYYHELANNSNYSNQRQLQNQKQSQNQSQSSKEHRCNDPRICKEQIKEDFQNEHPAFWRLTCYAHYKCLPNDIVGDVSPEELRAQAYEGAKQGLSLKDVAQREASMVAAKNVEFDALLRNPYKGPATQNSWGPQSSSFASSPFLTPPERPGTFISFGQPANLTAASPAQVFAQPAFEGTPGNSFNFGQPSGGVTFGNPLTTLSNGNPSTFGQQTNLFQQGGGIASPSPALQSPFANLPGSKTASHSNVFQSPFIPPLATTSQATLPLNQTTPGFPSSVGSPASFLTQNISPMLNAAAPVPQTPPTTLPMQAVPMTAEVDHIWFKEVWMIGEIPEFEPPPSVRI